MNLFRSQKLFILCCVLSSLFSTAYAQKKLDYYLSLSGQARFDSLEYQQMVYWEQADSSEVFPKYQQIKRYAQQTNDGLLSIFADYLKGLYYVKGAQQKDAYNLGYFKPLLLALQKQPNTPLRTLLEAHLRYFNALSFASQTIYNQETSDELMSADHIYRRIGYDNIVFASYRLTNIGGYFLYLDEVDTALKYYREAEQYVNKSPVDLHRLRLYKDLAKCLIRKKQYTEAIRYNKLAMAQIHLKKDSVRIGSISGNIGEILLNHTANPLEAEPYFERELYYRNHYNPKGFDDIAKAYGNLCQVAGIKGNSTEVVAYFEKALSMLDRFSKPGKLDALQAIYRNRIIADSLLGDFRSAFHYQRLLEQSKNRTLQENLRTKASEASVKFEAERFKLQAELANQQAKISRFWIITISLLLLMVLAGAYFIYQFQRNKQSKIAQQLAFEQKEAERLAELDDLKNRFFANISHEFRTPLTLILSPLQDLIKASPEHSTFKTMKQNAERLLTLINQLLDLSKLESGNTEVQQQSIEVVQFLKYLFSSFESLAQSKQILFQYEQSHEQWWGKMDTDKVEKITTNLLSNSFKFTPENGRIQVRVNFTDQQIQLKVQDFGIGIDSKQLPHIFDRFYQADSTSNRHYEGTGIGLALVKELVNALGGSITVESQVGIGTTFVTTLPCQQVTDGQAIVVTPILNDQTQPVEFSANNTTPDPSQTNGLILIVEDNRDLRHYIRQQFEPHYQVVEAKDGQEGIEIAIDLVPDLVICDLMMPRLDGFGFCKILKTNEITSHIPVVMLTAKATLENRLEGLELGADDYLAKPFNSDELQIRVRNLIQVRQNLRQKFNGVYVTENLTTAVDTTLDDVFLQRIRDTIEKHLSNTAFDVEILAEPMNISSVQLRRKLKALTGQTAIEFVRNYRLEKAATLLKNKKGNVSEVAYLVGFESLPYFSKSFQERFGKKPSEWI